MQILDGKLLLRSVTKCCFAAQMSPHTPNKHLYSKRPLRGEATGWDCRHAIPLQQRLPVRREWPAAPCEPPDPGCEPHRSHPRRVAVQTLRPTEQGRRRQGRHHLVFCRVISHGVEPHLHSLQARPGWVDQSPRAGAAAAEYPSERHLSGVCAHGSLPERDAGPLSKGAYDTFLEDDGLSGQTVELSLESLYFRTKPDYPNESQRWLGEESASFGEEAYKTPVSDTLPGQRG